MPLEARLRANMGSLGRRLRDGFGGHCVWRDCGWGHDQVCAAPKRAATKFEGAQRSSRLTSHAVCILQEIRWRNEFRDALRKFIVVKKI
jgi:hypothetical protein